MSNHVEPTYHSIKLASNGDIYIDRVKVAVNELAATLTRLKNQPPLVYFRESPQEEPSPKARGAFKIIAQVCKELGLAIQMGTQAKPEWGRLEGFRIEVSPSAFRFFLVRTQPFFIGITKEDSQEVFVTTDEIPNEEAWFGHINQLISADRLVETPMYHPEQFMQQDTCEQARLHVAAVFSNDERWVWQSCYELDMLPDNIHSLLRDCKRFALKVVGPLDKTRGIQITDVEEFSERYD